MFWLQPLTAAFTGWFTTWIAFYMLFHPRKPVKILGMTLQGIFPKRQQVFAAKLGGVVGKELLHFDEIVGQIKDPEALALVMPGIEKHIDIFLNEKLKDKLPVISMFMGQGTMVKIKESLIEEINVMLPEVIAQYADNLSNKINIEKIVTDKVKNFSSDKLEEILLAVMKKEFRFIELIGGFFGLLIGLIQMLLALI
ncbi:MAG: DUF445 family protein [Taibaiella sp.]|nr:DUF445 family protein [Taibaiella sp.]